MRKFLTLLTALILCCGCVLGICGCSEDETPAGDTHDTSAWFTAAELENMGLSGLTAPTGLSGDIHTTDTWYNNGYSFSQPCPDEATFTRNAEAYFEYFKTNYNGKFGTTQTYSSSSSEYRYYLVQKNDIKDYYSTNPCPTYTFYFVKDDSVDEDGYYNEHGVYSFEIFYDANSSDPDVKLFKIFIEDAYQNHAGNITYRYKTK